MSAVNRRPWIRRHPIAIALWALWLVVAGLTVAFPSENAGRFDGFGGWIVISVPLVSITWLVTFVIDHRKRSKMASSVFASSIPVQPQVPSMMVSVPPPPQVRTFQLTSIGDLLAMSPTEFEQLCVRALTALGYQDVRRTGGAGDLNADIVAKDGDGRSCIVQCKRYAPGSNVGSPVVQTFIGMKTVHHKADRGVIMTTAEFSRPAVDLATQHNIVLVDGNNIVKLVNLVGQGVGPTPLVLTSGPSAEQGLSVSAGIPATTAAPTMQTTAPAWCPRCGSARSTLSGNFCPKCGLGLTDNLPT